MIKVRRIASLVSGSAVMLYAVVGTAQVLSSPNLLPTTTLAPKAFGTQDYTVTMISATSFVSADNTQGSHTSGSLGRFGNVNVLEHFYATLDIPAGVIIDYIGLNNANDGTASVIGVQILQRNEHGGSPFVIAGISNSAHTDWQTDRNSVPIGHTYRGHLENGDYWAWILDVEIAASPNLQFFGWVEIWWRRVVSDPPFVATFTDVPVGHPYRQFIEALYAAGITSGCSTTPKNYCPDNPVTRGQMAVFLAKALGLRWPN